MLNQHCCCIKKQSNLQRITTPEQEAIYIASDVARLFWCVYTTWAGIEKRNNKRRIASEVPRSFSHRHCTSNESILNSVLCKTKKTVCVPFCISVCVPFCISLFIHLCWDLSESLGIIRMESVGGVWAGIAKRSKKR